MIRAGGLGLLCLFSWVARGAAHGDCSRAGQFLSADLSQYQDKVDRLSATYSDEQWKVETADPQASEDRVQKAFAALQQGMYQKALVQAAKRHALAAETIPRCPHVRRIRRAARFLEATVLTDDRVIAKEKENQARQDQLSTQNNAFRLSVPGEKEPVSKALYTKRLSSTENRSEREALYKKFNAQRPRQWLEWGFRDLLKARNEEGRLAGFKNYYEYRFFRSQLDLPSYRQMVASLKRDFAPKVRLQLAELARRHGIAKVEPWDISYLRQKNGSGLIDEWLKPLPESAALEIARRFYRGLGITVEAYGFRMDLFPRAGKNTHAFALPVMLPRIDEKGELLREPPMDIRFLANIKAPLKWDDVQTLVHELGHAIHAAEVRQPLGLFRQIGSIETEAFAMLLDRMVSEAGFLKEVALHVAKVPESHIQGSALKQHERSLRLDQAFTVLSQVLYSDFEHALYQDPDADFSALWSTLYSEYWGTLLLPEWASWDIEHYVMAPVYVQNYAIGIAMVEQLYEALRKRHKAIRTPAVGDRLRKELFRPGIEWDYRDFTQRFTGKPLGTEAVLALVR